MLLLAFLLLHADARALTLRDAVALAVRQNPALAAAGADVGIADAGITAARGLDDFLLEATGAWHQNRNASVAGTPVQQPATDQLSGALSLTKPLPTGGRLGLHLLGGYSRTEFETTIDMMQSLSTSRAYAPSVQLSLDHPLLRGFGVSVARADRRRARARRDLAGAQRENTAASLVRDVVIGYWELAFATRAQEIRSAGAASAREQLERVKANISVGKQPKSASAEIEVAIALRDEEQLNAQQAVVDRGLDLGRLCGLPTTASALTAADHPLPPARAPGSAREEALARNAQLQAVRAQGRAAQIEVEVTDNGLLPELDVSLSGGPLANARDARGALDQVRDLKSYTITAGLSFSLPLGRHAARGARDAARETFRKVRLGEADLTAQVTTAVAHAQGQAETARRRVEVLSRSTEAAALDLEAEKARFDVGRSTNFDVLRRQDSLASVQLALLRAQVDRLQALAVVDALTGDILDDNGVTLR